VNKRRNTNSSITKPNWLLYTTIGLLGLLLLLCFYTKKDPQSVLNDIYQYALGNKDKITKNDKQWNDFLIKKDKNIDSLNNVISSFYENTIPDSANVVTSSTGLNMRKLPSTESVVISKIPDGTKVKLHYRDDQLLNIGGSEGFWVKISHANKSGYVFSTYLDI
jgi:uncharacterized protein YgiM (DUF1202 family)